MNLSSEEIKGGNDAAEQVEIDDSPTALTTAPIRGYTALSSKEIVEVIDTVAPVLPESPLQPSPQTRVKTNEAQKSTANSYGGLGRGKGYGGLGGRSSLLQQRLRAGNIKHFDSGEHFRQQAEKTREEQSQRKQENRPHPLTGDSSSHPRLSSLRTSSSPTSIEPSRQLHAGHISRLHPPSPSGTLELKHPEAVPRRFKVNNDSSEEYSD